MTASMILSRSLHIGILCLFSLSLSAQNDLMASIDQPRDYIDQHSSNEATEGIIVDLNSNVQSYPSMEEEMKMYMELRSDEPMAFFFPNPSNGIVWVEHNLGKECKVVIQDRDGVILYTATNHKTQKLDLSAFKAGEYLIEVSNGVKFVASPLTVR